MAKAEKFNERDNLIYVKDITVLGLGDFFDKQKWG